MKNQYTFSVSLLLDRCSYTPGIKTFMISMLIGTGMPVILSAQDSLSRQPSWWIGAAAGANLHSYSSSTRLLNADFTAPATFGKGKGIGLYAAPLIEYRIPNSKLGIILQAGYDNRSGSFNEKTALCNCAANLSTTLSYITLEPSLKVNPYPSGFYLFAGPRVAFNMTKSFDYVQNGDGGSPEQTDYSAVSGDFSHVKKTIVSFQLGLGYDISLSSGDRQSPTVLSPFISFQPYIGQSPRSTETWDIAGLRIGAALKLGYGGQISTQSVVLPASDPEIQFTVFSPRNIPVERRVRETFPLRNYIFFDSGSTLIPDRYMLLTRDQVKDFKEDQLEVLTPKKLSGRSARGMVVYYNILNILGDRLQKNPFTVITLAGSSEKGPADGEIMAGNIKNYLVSVFEISAARIGVQGLAKPKIPSEQSGSTREINLLQEGDRRVSIESSSPALLMEFQSGPDASLRPVEFVTLQDVPLDSYVSFNVKGANEALSSWSLEIEDDKRKRQSFGPYTQETVRIPGKFILGNRPESNYKVTMTGQKKNGKTVTKKTVVRMAAWTPAQNEEGMRFSVLFEFDESKSIAIYEKYLTDIVTPKIPAGGTVIIHGHTDIIGEAAYNEKLSLARANDVRTIIEKALAAAGRNDVKLEVFGWGEDQSLSPFENKFPEERFYNRTVIIDIIPKN